MPRLSHFIHKRTAIRWAGSVAALLLSVGCDEEADDVQDTIGSSETGASTVVPCEELVDQASCEAAQLEEETAFCKWVELRVSSDASSCEAAGETCVQLSGTQQGCVGACDGLPTFTRPVDGGYEVITVDECGPEPGAAWTDCSGADLAACDCCSP